jgi:hypothetical protein
MHQCTRRSEHDALTADDIAVYHTPAGVLSSEVVPEGVYVPQVVKSKNVRKARGRMRVSEGLLGTAGTQMCSATLGCAQQLARGRCFSGIS